MNNKEIKTKAKEILNKYDINFFSTEKEIIEILDAIINEGISGIEEKKVLDNIERYLDIKFKMMSIESAYKSLNELSKKITVEQKVRKTDGTPYEVIFFKVKDIESVEHYFLTRERLETEISNKKELFGSLPNVEVETQNNIELYELLEKIKNVFR